MSLLTGLYRNSATAPKSQNYGFVSKKILAFSHCNCSLSKLNLQLDSSLSGFPLISLKKNVSLHTHCVHIFSFFFGDQIGVGLMFFQQFGGINGICFYVSNIFESAGS